MQELDVFVNEPFDASLIKDLFVSREDLLLASPYSSWPFVPQEWTDVFARNPDGISLIFSLEGTVIGHTSFLPRDEDMYICYVILHPNYRGQGHSQQMITLSEEFFRLNYSQFEELHLNVNIGNERARKLYEKLGYELYKTEDTRHKMKKRMKI
jgi:RimJ/RimL family protein N-acetyltransferase